MDVSIEGQKLEIVIGHHEGRVTLDEGENETTISIPLHLGNELWVKLKEERATRRKLRGQHYQKGNACRSCGAPIDDRSTYCIKCRPTRWAKTKNVQQEASRGD